MEFNHSTIETVRELIKKGQFSEALSKIEEFAPQKYLIEIQLLSYQFSEWKKKKMLNLEDDEISRNRIVYALLEILSEIESQNSSGKEKYIAQYRSKIEGGIKERYVSIENLYTESEDVSFLNRLLDKNQDGIETILKSISEQKDDDTIFKEFDDIITSVNDKSENVGLSRIVNHIKSEYSKDHLFFEKWLNSELEKERELNKLKWEISKYKEKYKKILSGSIITSIIFGLYHLLGIDIKVEIKEEYDLNEFDAEVMDFDTVEI